MIGFVIGWSWRPRWTGLLYLGLRSKLWFAWTSPPGAWRFWLACTAFSIGRRLWSRFIWKGKDGSPVATAQLVESGGDVKLNTGTSQVANVVVEKDLEHLLQLIENKGGKMEWQSIMGHSTSNLTYQAWRHDLENITETCIGASDGPIVYRSRAVFEDATPEMVRDFFWDDEFRTKWDTMLAYFKILKEYSHTGTMIVQCIKKFPFFCNDREYIIGRRIWEAGNTYYCVTKVIIYQTVLKFF
ncbi:hypothetical protein HYC85_004726 [Camellia sinensis]|uniref:START domain-containing protein n=1 Tax=Camellia sinensis TaxID=4442 RepID=A0A7J7HZ09_CAMSI|nr:hypothetical protein HYC85_004726 [Camellia sinensis]